MRREGTLPPFASWGASRVRWRDRGHGRDSSSRERELAQPLEEVRRGTFQRRRPPPGNGYGIRRPWSQQDQTEKARRWRGLLLLRLRSPREAPRIGQQRLSHTRTDAHIHHARAPPPQCSGVSTQVLAECTPALAGEGLTLVRIKASLGAKRAQARRRETIYARGS